MAQKQKFIITEDMLVNATTYIPLAEKIAFATTIAPACMEQVDMEVVKIEADATLALPQLVKENMLLKQLYLMEYLLRNYLHVTTPIEFTLKDYDYYAENHPLNQLERLKTNAQVKDRVFDLLADFKEVKKLLDTEIYNVKSITNEPVQRILASMTLLSDPDAIKAMTEQVAKEAERVRELQAKKKEAEESKIDGAKG